VAGDIEFVGDGTTRVRQAAAQRHHSRSAKFRKFNFQFGDRAFEFLGAVRGILGLDSFVPPSLVRLVLSGWERFDPSR